jgi:tetratricopeptide (TPR) repeat protein
MTAPRTDRAFLALPDPGGAGTLDELVDALRSLKMWAGNPSYDTITDQINTAWTAAGRPVGELARRGTVVDCFRPSRRRINVDLLVAVVWALHPDRGYVAQWQQAIRVVLGETHAATQVRAQDHLPPDLPEFIGRHAELDRFRQLLCDRTTSCGPAVILAIEGMAGVGKTQLAIHAGHMLARERPFQHMLFVNLRGFHPDPAQPPAEPAAALDSFLRILGVSGQQIPHDLTARSALYRRQLAGKHALVVLDNAVDEDQIRPLLPDDLDNVVLITSRRRLAGLTKAAHLAADLFTAQEALEFLARAVPDVPVGDDPHAPARVARRCGYLPLALGLMAGHMHAKPEWTVSDHADWLDERHHERRLDGGVEVALSLSYRHLPADRRRLLRLVALHPGPDLDPHAAAALTATDVAAVHLGLDDLCRDHLLQQPTPGRYTLHDLIRDYATGRARDEERPPERRAALTRLFDNYLATAATAMDAIHPAETNRRPRITPPATQTLTLDSPGSARAWLDTERPNLIAVGTYTATKGWPAHSMRLSATLMRYINATHPVDALVLHSHARHAGREIGDLTGEALALTGLAAANGELSRYALAAEQFEHAAERYERAGDHASQARALSNLGVVEERLGRYQAAADHQSQALALCRQAGDRGGEAHVLGNLGDVEKRLGRYLLAADHYQLALTTFRQLGNRDCEAWVLTSIGMLHCNLGNPDDAKEHHQQALMMFRDIGDRGGETWALNGLGEAAHADGRPADALTYHTAACTVATDTGDRNQQARALCGLALAHQAAGEIAQAHRHWQHALALYTELGVPEADQVHAHLAALTSTETDRS